MCICVHAQSIQPCPILCNPMDCSPPGSSFHGIFQARILEQIAISYPRGSTQGVNPLLLCLLHWQANSLTLVPSEKLKFRNLNILKHVFYSSSLLLSGFPGSSDGKASAYNAEDLGSIPGSGRSPGEGNGNPLQYPCLENPMD